MRHSDCRLPQMLLPGGLDRAVALAGHVTCQHGIIELGYRQMVGHKPLVESVDGIQIAANSIPLIALALERFYQRGQVAIEEAFPVFPPAAWMWNKMCGHTLLLS